MTVRHKGGNIDTDLYNAARNNNIAKVQKSLSLGANVNKTHENGQSALYVACTNRNIDINIIKLLLTAGADVNKADRDGVTPFYISCIGKRFDIVDALSIYGVDVNKATNTGQTPLFVACEYGNTKTVEKLLSFPEIDVNKASTQNGLTPLFVACQNDYKDIVEMLLSTPGIDVNKKIANGITALYIACYNGRVDNVKLLLNVPGIDKTNVLELAKKGTFIKEINSLIVGKEIHEYREPVGSVLEITSDDELPLVFPTVDSIIIHPLGVTEIPTLPESLVYLNISGNPIELKELPKNLQFLLCANCKLHELPPLPESLEYLDARDNMLQDIEKLPSKLYLTPMYKTNAENIIVNSSTLLLTGNPLPVGLINGYGSITQYSNDHVFRVISHTKRKANEASDTIYTMIIPKGTLLFRYSFNSYKGEEITGIDGHVYPEFNVFFYPYPFVADSIMTGKFLHVFELERDVEVMMGVSPSMNARSDRLKMEYMTSCKSIPTGIKHIKGQSYDPCFTRHFSTMNPTISGMFVLAEEDARRHIQNDMQQRFWTKYRTNFIDARNAVGVAEIILHPHENRFDNTSPINYKHVYTFDHKVYMHDDAWKKVDEHLKNGTWTIDLFTKFYVNYESVTDEVKARCVPPEEPYKLRFLNESYWQKGGKRQKRKTLKLKRNQT